MEVSPHTYQAKKSKYPKTRKLASSGENVQFFVLGILQNVRLMGIWCYFYYTSLNFIECSQL
ncbi:hypothetical protein COF68_10250 [Bacillus toyonensis]|nr:hypothetical protein CON60_03065 [Bacillus toyonensis]PED63336.1 hypothetical protein CON89_00045 [Bacillus toyonensis]PEJ89063.1 hypothetical protein CN687_23515 [Bacillus toyonensis]PEL00007.1 hypothetical protein CN614_30285 [Bacillus toyonensis]PEN42336.1 hypothetical protein CN541_01815 [Bacillus toyonensis]